MGTRLVRARLGESPSLKEIAVATRTVSIYPDVDIRIGDTEIRRAENGMLDIRIKGKPIAVISVTIHLEMQACPRIQMEYVEPPGGIE